MQLPQANKNPKKQKQEGKKESAYSQLKSSFVVFSSWFTYLETCIFRSKFSLVSLFTFTYLALVALCRSEPKPTQKFTVMREELSL